MTPVEVAEAVAEQVKSLRKAVLAHIFSTMGTFYRDYNSQNDGITTFLGRDALIKRTACHPGRVTSKLPTALSNYTVGVVMARTSSDTGCDCGVNGVVMHDGNGNGYEYHYSPCDGSAIWRENNWGRSNIYEVVIDRCRPGFDEWYTLIFKYSSSSGHHEMLVINKDDKLCIKLTANDNTYTNFTHISFAGGRPYYVHSVVVFGEYIDNVFPR